MDDAQKVTVLTATNYSASADGYVEFWSPVILPPGRRMLEALPWDGARRILDIGTGTGALIPEIRRLAPIASVMGVDPSLGMLARARRARAPLAAMDAMALGVRPGTFDVAVLAFVLFHVPDPLTVARRWRRDAARRRPGGRRPDDVGRGARDTGHPGLGPGARSPAGAW